MFDLLRILTLNPFWLHSNRREAARSGGPPEPPKLRQRPSESDVAAARALPNPKGRSQPDRPKETARNRMYRILSVKADVC